MEFVYLDDPQFLDFNFSLGYDPALRPGRGPDHRALFRMVIRARSGVRAEAIEFGGVMGWTLTPEAFESFQRTWGARPIAFRDWFYSKLYQFFVILLHDTVEVPGNSPCGYAGPPQTREPWREGTGVLEGIGPEIHPDELERAFDAAAKPGVYDWLELAKRCTQANAEHRFEVAVAFVKACAKQRPKTPRFDPDTGRRPRGDEEIEERDQIIAEQLTKGVSREGICDLLDRKRLPVTENMQANGVETWRLAWQDPDFRKDVQSIFSKAKRRFTAVD